MRGGRRAPRPSVRPARLLYRPSFVETLVLLVVVLIFVFVELVLVVEIFVVVFFVVVRGQIELDRRDAGHLEAGPAIRAAQLIALVDVEFVDFDFGVAFRAVGHTLPRPLPNPPRKSSRVSDRWQ